MVKIKILKEDPRVEMPAKSHADDAGFDLRAWLPEAGSIIVLKPGQRALIPTGIRFGIPAGYEVQVRPRSGLALKHGITIVNAPGTIDAGYIGPVGVIVLNTSSEDFTIRHGERIAQAVVAVIPDVVLEETSELEDSARGEGGYGSTGVS
mgnify:CR=1 FL=1